MRTKEEIQHRLKVLQNRMDFVNMNPQNYDAIIVKLIETELNALKWVLNDEN